MRKSGATSGGGASAADPGALLASPLHLAPSVGEEMEPVLNREELYSQEPLNLVPDARSTCYTVGMFLSHQKALLGPFDHHVCGIFP